MTEETGKPLPPAAQDLYLKLREVMLEAIDDVAPSHAIITLLEVAGSIAFCTPSPARYFEAMPKMLDHIQKRGPVWKKESQG